MLQIKSSEVQAVGNSEVVAMLERWLQRAKQGRIAFSVIVACENGIHAISDHAGSYGLTFAANWGLDLAKVRLQEQLLSRHEMPTEYVGNGDRVCYDISKGPACFDFLAWLVIAEMNRRRSGAGGPLKVCFKMIDTAEEHEKHKRLREAFYDGVIFPSLSLVGAIQDDSGEDAPVLEKYTLRPIVEFAKAGETVPLFTPSDSAVNAVAEYLKPTTGGKAPVTITLREAGYWEYRNSDLTEWLKVAEYLEASGERVIFLRDTARAMEPVAGYETCPAASIDLDTRMALYEAAKCNLFVSNGPWYLSLFGSKPWMMFIEPDAMLPSFPETPQFWSQWHGINPGEQFPWCKPNQRIIWKRDTSDRIITEWNNLPI